MASETELRDQLAVDRTHLANERTLLAYVRTGLALLAGGAGVLQFLVSPLATVAGWALVALGAVTLPVGLWRFLKMRERLRRSAPHPVAGAAPAGVTPPGATSPGGPRSGPARTGSSP